MVKCQNNKGEIKSLKKAIEEGEVEMLKDKCPKCGKLTLLTDDDTIWCRDEKNCGYEWFI
jgi:ribosomal protein S27AE